MIVHFLHPRNSSGFDANVAKECTGGEALGGLQSAGFLEPPPSGMPYGLVRAKDRQEILLQMSFGQVGVEEGEVIEVFQEGQGAR